MNKKLLLVVNAALLSLILYLHWTAIGFAAVNPDAGYYLSVAEAIGRGLVPYRDIEVGYTPLSMYLLAAGSWLLKAFDLQPSYESYLGTVLLMQYFAAAVFYRLALRFVPCRALCLIFSLSILLSFSLYEGIYIVLEPFVVLFALLALDCCFSQRYFLAGFFAFLSFFSKQYGLAIVLPLLLFVALQPDQSSREKLSLAIRGVLGFLVPCLSILTYFLVFEQVPFSSLRSLIFSSNPPIRPTNWSSIGIFLTQYGLVLGFAPLLFFNRKTQIKWLGFVMLATVLSFLPQFRVSQAMHYYINVIPFITLFGLYAGVQLWTEKRKSYRVFIGAVAVIPLVLTLAFAHRPLMLQKERDYRLEQLLRAEELNRFLDRGSNAFIYGNPAYYYLCDLRPLKKHKLSFGFLIIHNVEDLLMQIPCQEQILTEPSNDYFYQSIVEKFAREGMLLEEYLREQGFRRKQINSAGFDLWTGPLSMERSRECL